MQLRPIDPVAKRRRMMLFANNGGPGLRQALLDGAPFLAELTHSLIPTRGSLTPTFTRATTSTWKNNDGYMVTGVAGEIGFVGARRVDNLIRLGAAQSSTLAVAANVTMTLPAGAYQFSMGAGTGTATFSGTGGATGTLAASASARTFVAKTISAGTLIVTASVATLVDIQVVSMVAETDQTTARGYVSVGVGDIDVPLTNPNFDTDTAWTKEAGWTISGGTANFNGASPSNLYTGNGRVGVSVEITYTVSNYVSGMVRIRSGNSFGIGRTANGTYTEIIATTVNAIFGLEAAAGSVATQLSIENISGRWLDHGSNVDGVKCFPYDLSGNPIAASTMLGYSAEGAATNLCLQSNAFTTTWTTSGTVTASQNAVGPSGAANEAWTLGDADAGVLSDFRQELVIANDAVLRGMQVRVGKTVGATTFPGVGILLLTGTTVAGQWAVNTNLGTLTARSSNAGTVAATIEEAGNFWLIKMSATNNSTGNVTARLQMFPSVNADASATWVASTVGTAVFAYCGLEVGWPTSYIPTTTAAVTRNADQLYYTGADVANIKTLAAIGFKRDVGVTVTGYVAAVSNGAALTEYAGFYLASAGTAARFAGADGGVGQWDQAASNAYTPGTASDIAQSWATNSVRMSKDGVAQTADTTATTPSPTQLDIGNIGGSFQLNGNVGGIYGWTRNLSQSELNAVTA